MKVTVMIASVLFLAGCGTTNFVRPNTSIAQQEQDAARCRLVSRGLTQGGTFAAGSAGFVAGMLVAGAIGQASERADNYDDCMKAKGYIDPASPTAALQWSSTNAGSYAPPAARAVDPAAPLQPYRAPPNPFR